MSSEFSRNTVILIVGSLVAQAIPILLHPFLRRMFAPDDFGAMAIYLNLLAVITIASSLRYESTVVLPENNIEAANLLGLSVIINLIINLLLFFIIFFFEEEIGRLLNIPEKYGHYYYFLPISCFLFGSYQSMNYWLIRMKAFKSSSENKIIRRTIEVGVQFTSGLFKFNGGLFIGDFFGNLGNFLSAFRQVFRNQFTFSMISSKKMRFVFHKYIDYPKYNLLPTLLSNFATIFPFLLFSKFFSIETAGYLDLTRMVLSIPLIFVSSTISQVLFQHVTEKKRNHESIIPDVRNLLIILLVIVAVESLVVFTVGDSIFQVVFGTNYILSSFFSKILIFSFSLNFITSSFSSFFLIFNKIRINSIWQFFYFLSICTLLFMNGTSVEYFLIFYVTIESILLSINLFMLFSIVRSYEISLRKNTKPH
jgi:O-antigen/teichoic acid export membrane protein